ncbi:MAG: methyl-accepting chemotaxis protein [Elusimicrobia bacterium]|nr:methyl-accepting chemotaxis protein [Elusimicrobiota bacterium]
MNIDLLSRLGSKSLHVIVGALLVFSTFLVSISLSIFHYASERKTSYSDLSKRQTMALEKVSDRCTVALATSDIKQLNQILAVAVKEDPVTYAGFAIADVSGAVLAAFPSKNQIEGLWRIAEERRAVGTYHDYPDGRLSVLVKPVELRRWNPQGQEQTIALGKVIGAFSPREIEAHLRRNLIRTILIMLLCSFLGVGACYWILRSLIVKPLQDVVAVTRRMAEGRFDHSIEMFGRGAAASEIAVLRTAVAEMASTLINIVKAVHFTSSQIAASSHSLNQITQQSSINITQSVQVMSQISQSTSQVAQKTQAAASAGQQVGKSAQDGGRLALRVVERMKEAQNSVAASAGFIHELGKRSSQIGKIVDVITKIADQTNLLSLNAAIEAARAGESGRGFAVVASEVRKLAETSADSTQQISQLIHEVQEQTQRAIEMTEKGNRQVAESYQLTMEAEKLFTTIARDIQDSSRQMTQVAANTEQVAASTEEATASGEEQSAAMEKVAMNARELAQIVEKLKAVVSQFKVDTVLNE